MWEGYDVDLFIEILVEFRLKYEVEVILELGSVIVWEIGDLVSIVLDIIDSGGVKMVILDVFFMVYMLDILEMLYWLVIIGVIDLVVGKFIYCLGGVSCLVGDYLSEYSFENEFMVGDWVILKDMIYYIMVKINYFNGVVYFSICKWIMDGKLEVLKFFIFEDYKGCLL